MLILFIMLCLTSLSKAENRENIVEEGLNPGADKSYFASLTFEYGYTLINGVYYAYVKQLTPIDDAPPFDVVSCSVLENGESVNSPSFIVDNDGILHLNVAFQADQLTEQYGCSNLEDNSTKLINCRLLLKYTKPNSAEIYRKVDYVMTIRMSQKGPTEGGTNPILSNGCDCILIEGQEVISNIYKDEYCELLLQPDDVITYGSTICIELTSTSSLLQNMYFTTTKLTLTYYSDDGENYEMDILAISRTSCGDPCRTAVAYAVFSLPVVGEVRFNQVVTLDKKRLLARSDGIEEEEIVYITQGIKSEYARVKVVNENEDNKDFEELGISLGLALIITVLIVL